ncbi:MAG: hypothetical protein A2Y73_05200 [Chloroflexi bacterium RBG_13_56_8]|nr:MAG: hypothetical protein A2Y73_05200 [Chloroflexi bacterium RBG_13_56_8]
METEKSVEVLLRPARKLGVKSKDIGGELVLYEIDGEQIHILNPTAQLIWELCDGEHTPEKMEWAIRENFAVPEGQDVVGDIRRTLETLANKGLLVG